jgi:hypothetical protein
MPGVCQGGLNRFAYLVWLQIKADFPGIELRHFHGLSNNAI